MELKLYLKVLFQKWWIVLPTFLVTLVATIVFTYTQDEIYSSTATFVVVPNAEGYVDLKSFGSAVDTLSRRTEIATTYTEVASSRSIRKEAIEALGWSSEVRAQLRLSVSSKLRAGTNVLEITVEGLSPEAVQEFANMVGERTVTYASNLYETFILKPLDEATRSSRPIKPNKRLNVILGAVFGFVLGAGLAFLTTYLQTPSENKVTFTILDDETGAYNRHYLMQRLGEEMSRAKRNHYNLSLALMSVDQLDVLKTSALSSHSRTMALQMVAAFLKRHIREEDVLARLGETTFAFLLPDMSASIAKALLENLLQGMARTPFELDEEGVKLDLSGATGITTYDHNGTRQEELIAQAGFALQYAESVGYGKVCLFTESLVEKSAFTGEKESK